MESNRRTIGNLEKMTYAKNPGKIIYEPVTQEEIDEEEREKKIKEYELEQASSNKYKSRIIDVELNSSLNLQMIIYYHFFYCYMTFFIQTTSVFFKIWVFYSYQFNIIKVISLFVWIFIDLYRIEAGYKANIEEAFTPLVTFILITFLFCLPLQIFQIMGDLILPIDFACVIIHVLLYLLEIILAVRSINYTVKRQSNVYTLRNSSTKVITNVKIIKTSKEIEEELFYKFPNLKKKFENSGQNLKKNFI